MLMIKWKSLKKQHGWNRNHRNRKKPDNLASYLWGQKHIRDDVSLTGEDCLTVHN